jgi:glycolate oxidase
LHGGIVLAMYRLNRIIEVREDDLQVVVQPGVIYDDLNAQMRKRGMFFPPAPGGSDVAPIGGMVAHNSSGMRAVKYGVTRDYVNEAQGSIAQWRDHYRGQQCQKDHQRL